MKQTAVEFLATKFNVKQLKTNKMEDTKIFTSTEDTKRVIEFWKNNKEYSIILKTNKICNKQQ